LRLKCQYSMRVHVDMEGSSTYGGISKRFSNLCSSFNDFGPGQIFWSLVGWLVHLCMMVMSDEPPEKIWARSRRIRWSAVGPRVWLSGGLTQKILEKRMDSIRSRNTHVKSSKCVRLPTLVLGKQNIGVNSLQMGWQTPTTKVHGVWHTGRAHPNEPQRIPELCSNGQAASNDYSSSHWRAWR
jgi:hypothetical protein